MSDLVQDIEETLTQAIARDELELPSLPEVALRIREAAEEPEVSAQSLGAVVCEDPGLAARLLKVANSPLFRATRPIDDLNLAISRMGVQFAANLAAGMAMEQLFQATSDVVDRTLRRYWNQALEVAAIAAVLARTFTSLRADVASLAGLTHIVGVLPVLAWAEAHPGALSDSITLERVIDRTHGDLGSAILHSWGFPEEVARVPKRYRDFTRRAPRADYVDVVTVAYLQSLSGSAHPHADLDWAAIPAFGNLGLEPDACQLEEEAVASARVALGA